MKKLNQPRKPQVPRSRLSLAPLMSVQTFVALTTLVISLALAYATFVQADAARKSQVSQTWPYISYSTSNALPDGTEEISMVLTNNGVGPARLEQMELLYKGKPMPNPREFLRQCCAGEQKFVFMSAPVTGVLRPGETSQFIRLPKTPDNVAIWDKFNTERWNAVVRSCYCSIFDDCWVAESGQMRPKQVESCPADWSTFEERPFEPGKAKS